MLRRKILIWAGIPLLALYISTNWYQLMLIQGESMAPAYYNMQLVLLNRHSQRFNSGDVVAFSCEALSCVLVKRIAACPGDTVVIRDGTLYVNGRISEVYPKPGMFAYSGILSETITLGESQYLLLGDNVDQSKDSRYENVGLVSEQNIIGIVCNGK